MDPYNDYQASITHHSYTREEGVPRQNRGEAWKSAAKSTEKQNQEHGNYYQQLLTSHFDEEVVQAIDKVGCTSCGM